MGGAADPLQAFFDGAAEPPTPAEPDPEALAAEVDTVLDWLAERRHQSDARFVESRVHARAPKLGQARIRQELARHGVELDADTQQALKDTEAERAREVWRKRFGEPATDPAERARQMRFLAARGFAPALIRRIVGGRDDD
ncbi:RecX family transcriptional regulator [Ideonella sp. 3Y2]|uniref:Regulatory protein RecX n=1 Tax=Ideonella alba TaxID=2824118 RepID=A0A940YG08_9BURK|nr:RecX family transcriptional regulator [Ideonella alba]